MNYSRTAMAIFACLCIGAAAPEVQPRPKAPVPAAVRPPLSCLNCDLAIPQDRIPAMEHEALSGNGETAWKLALFYRLGSSDGSGKVQILGHDIGRRWRSNRRVWARLHPGDVWSQGGSPKGDILAKKSAGHRPLRIL